MTSNPLNPSNGDEEPKDPLAEMLKNLMGGQGMGNIDPAELAKAAGLPDDPNLLAQMFSQVQAMMSASSGGPRQLAAGARERPARGRQRLRPVRHGAAVAGSR